MDERIVADDGRKLWATAVGDGPPLIMCHGGPGLWDMFGDLADDLASELRVIRWDQRGGGRSERRGPYTVARMLADLDVVRRHFGLERTAVLGHSWGATLALRYAQQRPDVVDRLVYVAGVGLGRGWRTEFARNFTERLGDRHRRWVELRGRDRTATEERELAIIQWTADFADPGRATEFAERMATPWFPINYDCNAELGAELRTDSEPAQVAACRDLAVPTLIVDGADDVRPRWAVDSLAGALPDVRRVTFADAGHLPWFEDPAGFRSAVVHFIRTPS